MLVLKLLRKDFCEEELENEYLCQTNEVKRRIDRRKSKQDRQLSLAGLLLLRKGVGQLYGIDDYSVKYSENGKPFLDFCFFSISHSGGLAVCAISDNPIGIDTEAFYEIKPRESYMLFSKNESRYVNEKPELRSVRYLRLWTMKEALIKLRGGKLRDAVGYCFPDITDDPIYLLGNLRFTTENDGGYIITVCEEVL